MAKDVAKDNKRRIRFVNRAMQWRYILLMGSVGIFVATVLSVVVFSLLSMTYSDILRATGLEGNVQVVNYMSQQKIFMLVQLGGTFFFLVFFMAGLGFVISRKVAGPMHALKRGMREFASGNSQINLKFRKGDEFQELAEAFNEMVNSHRERLEQDIDELGKIRDQDEESRLVELAKYREDREKKLKRA